MSTVEDVAIEIPIGAAIEAIGEAVGTVARGVGLAGRQMFCNANLQRAVETLFPSAKDEGPTVRFTIPDGSEIVFEPSGSLYRARSTGAGTVGASEAIARVYQAYADLQLKDAAARNGLSVVERRMERDGTIRIRLGTQGGKGAQGEVTAEVGTDGRVRLEAERVEGPQCEELLKPFARAVGRTMSSKRKPAYSRPGTKSQQRSRARQKGA